MVVVSYVTTNVQSALVLQRLALVVPISLEKEVHVYAKILTITLML